MLNVRRVVLEAYDKQAKLIELKSNEAMLTNFVMGLQMVMDLAQKDAIPKMQESVRLVVRNQCKDVFNCIS